MKPLRYALGCGALLVLALQFIGATRPILRYVEYAGVIPQLEALAGSLGEDDLLLVESRGVSDMHVLALPLAYIYARNVLVIRPVDPDPGRFTEFLAWARQRFSRILFAGGDGMDLLSRTVDAVPMSHSVFRVPEYERVMNGYPRGVRFKQFEFDLYELRLRASPFETFDLDVGLQDDLYVEDFFGMEQSRSGTTYRWSKDVSHISVIIPYSAPYTLSLFMSDGGRPGSAEQAMVHVWLDDESLGTVTVTDGFTEYALEIPPALASALATSVESHELTLETDTWNPSDYGSADARDLGVMVGRVRIE